MLLLTDKTVEHYALSDSIYGVQEFTFQRHVICNTNNPVLNYQVLNFDLFFYKIIYNLFENFIQSNSA